MTTQLRFLLRHYWVEMVMIPPFLIVVCHFLYGDAYWKSWHNFAYMTFPWVFSSLISPVACHWVRNYTLQRFTKLDDWPKRVFWSILGYLVFTVGFAKLTYATLCATRYADLVPTEKKFYGLVIIAFMCVLIIATMYEGITYFGKWKDALTETELLEKLQLETQFQSLQSQLNPHFLFNSLNVLSSLIAENPRRAEDFVDELSNVYRYLLRSNERELASVGEELRFIRSFFHLLKTRHDTGIALKIDVTADCFSKKLPALALQILVENAVKHNEISPEFPLNIEIFSTDRTISADGWDNFYKNEQKWEPADAIDPKIVVRNKLQRKSTKTTSNRVGLDNLRQRYALLGVPGFELRDDGQYFTVVLPLM